jgi:nitroreductase
MDMLDTMLRRRSVRTFTDEPVSEEDLEKVLDAGMLVPTGKGVRPWHFIVVTNPERIRSLIGCRKGGPKMLETATAVIAVLGDTTKTDTCIEDSSVAMAHMHLMASTLGLGSCWLQVRLRPSAEDGVSTEEFIRQRLHFPEEMELEAMLVLGHPAKAPVPHTLEELPQGRVHREQW